MIDHTPLLSRLENVQAEIVSAALRAENQPQPSGEWALSTILIHLALVEEVIWQARLKQMAEQENPHWVWTEPSLDDSIARLGQRPLTKLAELFTESRKKTLTHLENLSEEDWTRVGTHARLGQMDVAGLGAQILEHDEEHLVELNRRAQVAIP